MQCDVFCRVVDNFGDIGVTYRLVRQLKKQYAWTLRLWVDNLDSFKRLEPLVHPELLHQTVADIEVLKWDTDTNFSDILPAEIVIASFSCDLPTAYLRKMHDRDSRLINLDYLSAEPWVEGVHGLPSLRSDGLPCHFFFPGFNQKTGGLLREQYLIAQRDQWQSDLVEQTKFLISLGVSRELCDAWADTRKNANTQAPQQGRTCWKIVSLFCYPQAQVMALLSGFEQSQVRGTDPRNIEMKYLLLVPQGIAPELKPGQHPTFSHSHIVRIPFLPQTEFDKILWTADINFVRGEDSLVRALWAGRPMVWQIYPQREETHFLKLKAWLSQASLPSRVEQLFYAWNAHRDAPTVDQACMQVTQPSEFDHWVQSMSALSQQKIALPDLAANLVAFCQQSTSMP
jgi:uncharacterized repeat protein (TIGR03837 family)